VPGSAERAPLGIGRTSRRGTQKILTRKLCDAFENSESGASLVYRDAFERAQHDLSFLEAVRSTYVGDWDALDALWWQSHPTSIAPSGNRAPAVLLNELQHRVFSANGDAIGDEEVARSLHELKVQIQTERQAINDAVELASSNAATLLAPNSVEVITLNEPEPLPETPLPAAPGRKRFVILGCAAALIVGIFAGTQLNVGSVEATSTGSSSIPTPSAAKIPAFSVFDHPQQPEDIPALVLPDTFNLDSFRALNTGLSSPYGTATIFAARSSSNMVCLVVLGTGVDYLSTCSAEGEFPASGLRLWWPSALEYESDGVFSTLTSDSIAVLKPDGSLESGRTER
jgi:hypothetical protein